jgi:multiple sugar transport system permease protein
VDPVVVKGGPGVARSSTVRRFRYGPFGLPIPRLGRRLPDRYLAVIMLAPALALMAAYVVYPLANIVYSAFTTQATLSSPHEWVGLGNFTGYLFQQDFFPTLGRSVYYTVANIVVQTLLGFIVALVLHASLPGRNVARGMILFPFLVPIVVAALIWHFILDDLTGVANYMLTEAHLIKQPLGWLSDPGDAMNAIVAISVWKYVPFMIILFLARLQTVPVELIEAAHVDGAGGLRTLWHIILPYMAPVVVVAVMLRTIFSFNEYEVPFLMTQGGPDNKTLVLPILIRQMLLTDLQTGPAAAVSLLMLLVLVACGLGYWYFYRLGEKAFE